MLNPKKDMELVREEFLFDHCFDSTKPGKDTQTEVYAMLGPQLLDSCFAGYNACLFAYGQTGSGKTYTMMGEIEDEQAKGVVPRLVTEFFHRLDVVKAQAQVQKSAKTFSLEASYLEIYCEKARDLLVRDVPECQVRSTPERGVFVDGLTTHKVTAARDVYKLLNQGARNRATACTNLNAHSSRSHAILTLNYTETMYASGGEQRVQTRAKTSRMYLVDLAGSERVKLSGVTGANLDEAKKINQSLTSLGRIIDLLADRKPGKPCVLPVRESLLTWLLGDSLGGNSRTIMLAAVSPSAQSYDETLSTLRYAARTKCIINETSVNETVDLKLVEDLKGQIDELQILLKHQSDLAIQLQTNEEKMSALQRMLEEERLAKERSDQEQKERAEEERRLLEEKLQNEREQLEQYLGRERLQLQERLAAANSEIERLELWGQGAVQDAEKEKRSLKEHFDRSMKDAAEHALAEQRRLTERCEAAARRAAELDTAAVGHARDRAGLQAQIEELQRRIAELQLEFQLKEQGWKHEMALLQDQLERSNRRLQDLETASREKEIDWAKARNDLTAQYEMEITRLKSGNTARVSEVTQGHQQALAAVQRQSDERFQKLKEDLREQFEADLKRLQLQQEGTSQAAVQQHEEERRRARLAHEALVQEMATMRTAGKRQQAECQVLKQQCEQLQGDLTAARTQHEEHTEHLRTKHAELLEQARLQYDEECQRVLHQQGEAVKEIHRKRDAALSEVRKKASEDTERMRRHCEEKVARLKASHDEAFTSLQGQIEATLGSQRLEHQRALASQATRYAAEAAELEKRLAAAEAKVQQRQREADGVEASSAGALREATARHQSLERRHREEVGTLVGRLTALYRLFEQQQEACRWAEDQLKATQRRLESVRLATAKDAVECRVSAEFKWAVLPESPVSRGTPLRDSSNLPRPGGMEFTSPDVRRTPRSVSGDLPMASPAPAVAAKKPFDANDSTVEAVGAFDGGHTGFLLPDPHVPHIAMGDPAATAISLF